MALAGMQGRQCVLLVALHLGAMRANLLDGIEGFGGFDLIFCRHVLSDMTGEGRRRVLDGLARAVGPAGCLFVGEGEILPEAGVAFRPVAGLKSVYVRGPSSVSQAA